MYPLRALTSAASAVQVPRGVELRQMELTYITWDPKTMEYIEDERSKKDILYTAQLEKVDVRQAADLELSYICGYGLDQDGGEFKPRRYWHPVSVRPGGQGW